MVGGANVWDRSDGTRDCRGASSEVVTSYIRVFLFQLDNNLQSGPDELLG